MSSKIKLNNNQGDTITLEHSNTISSLGSRVIPLDNITHKVSTIAELRAMTERPEFVYVTGYHTADDGAFGSHFFKRSLVVEADNGGTVIQSVNDTYELQYEGAVNVKWFGAVSDSTSNITGTENRVAFQSAADLGADVFIPAGGYRLNGLIIDKQITMYGDGMGNTKIYPSASSATITIATDHVSLRDFQITGTSTAQFDLSGSCITVDAWTNNNAFMRHMEGIKIERIKFLGLAKNGINVRHLLRESHIRECRFLGMGNEAYGTSAIYMKNLVGNASHTNNIWIDKNVFFRFETPPINLVRSALISPVSSLESFAQIRITSNLIHGQLIDESLKVETVQPAPCNHISIQDGSSITVIGNNITAIHPVYNGIKLVNGATGFNTLIVNANTMSTSGTVGGVTYSRDENDENNATGSYVHTYNANSINITDNSLYGGVYVSEIILDPFGRTARTAVVIDTNTSTAGVIAIDYSLLGDLWDGYLQQYNNLVTNYDTTVENLLIGDGETALPSLTFSSDPSTGLSRAGTVGNSAIRKSINGSLVLLEYETTVRPYPTNVRDLGTSANQWKTVNSSLYNTDGLTGKSGTFTTTDGKTVTVTNGIITSIV